MTPTGRSSTAGAVGATTTSHTGLTVSRGGDLSRSTGGSAAIAAGLVLLGLAGVAYLYRPWEANPLPVRDFGTFLDVLRLHGSWWNGFAALARAHAAEGRFAPLSMLAVATGWAVAGTSPAAWQLSRTVIMCALIALSFVALRRLGVSRTGATLGAAIFLYSGAAADAWTLPQAMEPVGALFGLTAAVLATSYQRTGEPLRMALGLAALLSAATLVKEPLVAMVPFILLVAASERDQGLFVALRPSRRNAVLVACVALGVGLTAILPMVVLRASASDASYAARYSPFAISAGQAGNTFRATFLPVTRVILFPANVFYVVALAIGWWVGWRSEVQKSRLVMTLLVAVALPLAGAIIYAPWPAFPGYYALPFVFGTAMLLGYAVTFAQRARSSSLRHAVLAACALMFLYGSVVARNIAAAYTAERRVEAQVLVRLAQGLGGRALIVAVPDPMSSGRIAESLRRYAAATHDLRLPAALDLSCSDAAALIRRTARDSIVVAFGDRCADVISAARDTGTMVRVDYVTRSWKSLRASGAVWQAVVWAGGATRADRPSP